MKCIYCGCEDSKVLDSRNSENSIRRRRECISCGRRFTTYETIDAVPFLIVKKDGSRQSYDSKILKDAMLKVCEERPISAEQIDEIIKNIEKNVQNKMLQEVTSSELVDIVAYSLKKLDDVSFLRYIAMYKNFDNIDDFKKILEDM